MGTPHRPPADSLSASAGESLRRFWQRVADAPHAYDLYHLLRWLDARAGGRVPLGRATHPADEPVRLGQQPSLAFAPSTLACATAPRADVLPQVSIYSFGLFGPNGPLPLHLTEFARDRARNYDDRTLTAFADVFHHRLILLFYRVWADAQPTVSLDRREGARFDNYLASLVHLGLPALRRRDEIPDHAKYFMAAHLVRQTRNPEGLRQILRAYLGVPVEIVEHVPHWIPVGARQRTTLRTRANTQRLGAGAMLGIAALDAHAKFEIRVGPLSREAYLALLPGTRRARQLTNWVRQYIGLEWAWDLRLVLAADQVTGNTLGRDQPLGWGSWLGTRTRRCAADDLVYSPETSTHRHAQAE